MPTALEEVLGQWLGHGDAVTIDDLLTLRAGGRAETVRDTAALAAALAERLGESATKVRMALALQIKQWRSELIAGRPAAIAQLMRIRPVAGETRIKEESQGRRLIAAGALELRAMASQSFAETLGQTRLEVIAERSLVAEIGRTGKPLIVMLTPEKDFFVDTITYHFERRGWAVAHGCETSYGLEALSTMPVSLVIVDARLADAEKVATAAKAATEAGPVSLVEIYPQEEDTRVKQLFRMLPDERVTEPFEIGELLEAVSRELARCDLRGSGTLSAFTFEVRTIASVIEEAKAFLATALSGAGHSESTLVAIQAAFREALANAAMHGNASDRTKKISVRGTIATDGVTLTVTDEGQGFDHTRRMAELERPDALDTVRDRVDRRSPGGVGLLLMRRCVDALEYSTRGNSVTLFKRA